MGVGDISFKHGYSAKYYVSFVSPETWTDFSRMDITGGSISRENDGLMNSADISCVNYAVDTEQLIRIYMDVTQNRQVAHIPLFTGWASCPQKNYNGTLMTTSLQCYSVLKPAQDILLTPGWYAPLDTDSEELLRELLKPTGAPLDFIDSMPALKESVIAEENENNLSMAQLILSVVGFRMQILGDGTIRIFEEPKAEQLDPDGSFDYVNNDILETQVTINHDWYGCPNVFRAIAGDVYAVARDDSDSMFSIKNRGREIWAQESSCDLKENESIAEYAVRRLEELQMVYKTVSYTRRFQPYLYPLSFVRINYPGQDIQGIYRIMSQIIDLGYGAKTSEEAVLING